MQLLQPNQLVVWRCRPLGWQRQTNQLVETTIFLQGITSTSTYFDSVFSSDTKQAKMNLGRYLM